MRRYSRLFQHIVVSSPGCSWDLPPLSLFLVFLLMGDVDDGGPLKINIPNSQKSNLEILG